MLLVPDILSLIVPCSQRAACCTFTAAVQARVAGCDIDLLGARFVRDIFAPRLELCQIALKATSLTAAGGTLEQRCFKVFRFRHVTRCRATMHFVFPPGTSLKICEQ